MELRPTFTPHLGVLDPRKPRSAVLNVPFNLGCGDDKECESDLMVEAATEDLDDDGALVIGSRKTLTQLVNVTNHYGDPAFAPGVRIQIPSLLSVRKSPAECQTNSKLGEIICEIYGPLKATKSFVFEIIYDVSNLKPFDDRLTWNKIEVYSDSKNHKEIDLTNNIGKRSF